VESASRLPPRAVVVVGGGLAAATCCETLRASGFDGSLVVLGAEPQLPYERPPLSKGYLLGTQELDKAFVHDAGWYRDRDVELQLGRAATRLDVEAHTVATDQGQLSYDRLLIATGASPRRLPMADDSGAPVAYLRTIADSERIKATLQPGRRLVVVGAGWIGLEVAAAARTAGCEVVVIEPATHPLLRVLGPEVAAVFAELHRAHGVDLRTGVTAAAISTDGRAGRVVVALSDGSSVTGDALVVGIGVVPTSSLAEEAGLRVDNGVLADEYLRSSHPDVFAAGDVANAYHPLLGRHLRVEHWDNAIGQGRVAAANLLGAGEAYERLPYFFTDQYDLGMEYVGSTGPDGYDEVVVRGDLAARVFTAFWVKDGSVVAGMQANDWDATEHVRRILDAEHAGRGRHGDPAGGVDVAALRDPRVPLEDLAR
jgi:3-phenylpropionate/trans-cinnamate dioxygenase ferredoxin reductase component